MLGLSFLHRVPGGGARSAGNPAARHLDGAKLYDFFEQFKRRMRESVSINCWYRNQGSGFRYPRAWILLLYRK